MNDSYRSRPVTQVEVERRIAELTDEVEEAIDIFADAASESAIAEAEWKRLYHTALLHVDASHNRPGDAKGREAKAHAICRGQEFVAEALNITNAEDDPDRYRTHLFASARLEHAREALRAKQSMLSAQQTLLRSIANQT